MRGWSRERGAGAGVVRDPEGQSWRGGENAAHGLSIGRGLFTWPAGLPAAVGRDPAYLSGRASRRRAPRRTGLGH